MLQSSKLMLRVVVHYEAVEIIVEKREKAELWTPDKRALELGAWRETLGRHALSPTIHFALVDRGPACCWSLLVYSSTAGPPLCVPGLDWARLSASISQDAALAAPFAAGMARSGTSWTCPATTFTSAVHPSDQAAEITGSERGTLGQVGSGSAGHLH